MVNFTLHLPLTVLLFLFMGCAWKNFVSSGGVKFSELDEAQQFEFNENIVRTMSHIEQTFYDLASRNSAPTLVVCDRGMMDPSACESCLRAGGFLARQLAGRHLAEGKALRYWLKLGLGGLIKHLISVIDFSQIFDYRFEL